MGTMKATFAVIAALIAGLAALPVLAGGADPAVPGPPGCLSAGSLHAILATIRQLESGGDYSAQARGSSASGAYQFIDTTWDHYGGYQRAADAPRAVQDAKAAEHVNAILLAHSGDIGAVPVVWYIGHLPATDSSEWDTIPYPSAGNVLTPRQYQTKWLAAYRTLAIGDRPIESNAPCEPEAVPATPDGWALPGPWELIHADPSVLEQPHHDYPAWDWAIPEGTPIYAIRGGTITNIHTWPHNWWDQDCDVSPSGCDACGTGLTITDTDGTAYTYCHGRALTAQLGQSVTAGRQIMLSGNTGRSTGPHLHLDIRSAQSELVSPQPRLQGTYRRLEHYFE